MASPLNEGMWNPAIVVIAKRFHENYERLSREFINSSLPVLMKAVLKPVAWEDLPEAQRGLLCETVARSVDWDDGAVIRERDALLVAVRTAVRILDHDATHTWKFPLAGCEACRAFAVLKAVDGDEVRDDGVDVEQALDDGLCRYFTNSYLPVGNVRECLKPRGHGGDHDPRNDGQLP